MTLTADQFASIQETAKQLWGLHITERKRQLVTSRLQKHLHRSRWSSVGDYLEFIAGDATEEDRLEFFDLLSTNVTSFFREPGAFDYLERELWTPLKRGNLTLPERCVRIWSAACSSGPEPYSLAIHALEHLGAKSGFRVTIDATDLASTVLAVAKRGIYRMDAVKSLDPAILKRYFQRGKGKFEGHVRVCDEVRSMVTFTRANLMEPWKAAKPYDVIFCRNCMIYFDQETRADLVSRFHGLLRPNGIFVIGSSETLTGSDAGFTTAQPAVYRK